MLVTKKNENFSCQVCNKNFKSVNILHVHQKTHGDKIYNCYICYKIYKNKAKLNEHLKTHMSENICIVCSKKFSSNAYCLKLMRTDWLQVKNFLRQNKCPIYEVVHNDLIHVHRFVHPSILFDLVPS